MSRSKKGSKGLGFDYWGRRGIDDKETVKGRERMQERMTVKIEKERAGLDKEKDAEDVLSEIADATERGDVELMMSEAVEKMKAKVDAFVKDFKEMITQ